MTEPGCFYANECLKARIEGIGTQLQIVGDILLAADSCNACPSGKYPGCEVLAAGHLAVVNYDSTPHPGCTEPEVIKFFRKFFELDR